MKIIRTRLEQLEDGDRVHVVAKGATRSKISWTVHKGGSLLAVDQEHVPGPSHVSFEQLPIPEFLKKETVAEAGASSFLILNKQVKKYTCMGADNKHHAEMKATKLFGQGWTEIMNNEPYFTSKLLEAGYRFLPVKKFNQLIALLQTS